MENEKDLAFDIREKERHRIARDVHDITLQNLSHLIHKVELTSLYMERDIVKAKLELATIEKGLRKTIEDTRMIIYNLHPIFLEELGLKEVIEKSIRVINKNYNFLIETDIDDVSCENNNIQLTILRLVQECCLNALRHSKGNKLSIFLKYEDNTYILKVSDNGVGLDETKIKKNNYHFGLDIMKERVQLLFGKMNISSSDCGTTVTIEIPDSVE